MTISIAEWRYQSKNKISKISDTADVEINAILCKVIKKNLAWCLAHSDYLLNPSEIIQLSSYLDDLASGVPLAYILGEIEFFGRTFIIDENVLIPRPETELLVEAAKEWILNKKDSKKIIDVGCGSGIIIISLLRDFPSLKGVAVDISRGALTITNRNKMKHKIDNLDLIQSDTLSGIYSKFDIILANLPYIPESSLEKLAVSKYEPKLALNGGEDGLQIIKRLIDHIPTHINTPGLVLLEIQNDQSVRVMNYFTKILPNGIITTIQDYSGLDRVIKVEV